MTGGISRSRTFILTDSVRTRIEKMRWGKTKQKKLRLVCLTRVYISFLTDGERARRRASERTNELSIGARETARAKRGNNTFSRLTIAETRINSGAWTTYRVSTPYARRSPNQAALVARIHHFHTYIASKRASRFSAATMYKRNTDTGAP